MRNFTLATEILRDQKRNTLFWFMLFIVTLFITAVDRISMKGGE